jgi:hypothetical protein
MLIQQAILNRIAAGEVKLAFRIWQKPTVKPGGTLRTAVGVLQIDEVLPTTWEKVTARDAKLAGFASRAALIAEVDRGRTGTLYRIKLSLAGPDPRIALRKQAKLGPHEIEELRAALGRLDARSPHGPWTNRVLTAIANHPDLPARELAIIVDIPKQRLKLEVRKLKNLGLTESLHPGYRIAPRGQALLRSMSSQSQ